MDYLNDRVTFSVFIGMGTASLHIEEKKPHQQAPSKRKIVIWTKGE